MYYIICTSRDEYLFDYNLANKEIEVTPMDIEARQFTSRIEADWVADRIGGEVLEVRI